MMGASSGLGEATSPFLSHRGRHRGGELAAFSVDALAANGVVRKNRAVGTVSRRPLSQQANSFLRTESVASFGLSSFVID